MEFGIWVRVREGALEWIDRSLRDERKEGEKGKKEGKERKERKGKESKERKARKESKEYIYTHTPISPSQTSDIKRPME